jgi:LytS/YehU family sensor histidine kinase
MEKMDGFGIALAFVFLVFIFVLLKEKYREEKIKRGGQKRLWIFGIREIILTTIGTFTYVVPGLYIMRLLINADIYINFPIIVPIFFGIAFGPWVGLLSGVLGSVILYGWEVWAISTGILGLISGLAFTRIENYRKARDIRLGLVYGAAGVFMANLIELITEVFPLGIRELSDLRFYAMWIVRDLIFVIIILPVIMVVYSYLLARNRKSKTAASMSYSYNSAPQTYTNSESTYGRHKTVILTKRNELTSWALHKQPGDVQLNDYVIPPSADVVIHREGGIAKIVKGPYVGRILSEEQLKDYLDSL